MDSFEKVQDGIYKCKTCGEQLSSGIMNISSHWDGCTGKEFSDAMMDMAKDKNGNIQASDLDRLQKQFLT